MVSIEVQTVEVVASAVVDNLHVAIQNPDNLNPCNQGDFKNESNPASEQEGMSHL